MLAAVVCLMCFSVVTCIPMWWCWQQWCVWHCVSVWWHAYQCNDVGSSGVCDIVFQYGNVKSSQYSLVVAHRAIQLTTNGSLIKKTCKKTAMCASAGRGAVQEYQSCPHEKIRWSYPSLCTVACLTFVSMQGSARYNCHGWLGCKIPVSFPLQCRVQPDITVTVDWSVKYQFPFLCSAGFSLI